MLKKSDTSGADSVSEDDLIAALKAGDSAAYKLAAQRYSGAMLFAAKAASLLHAEDAVQDAWIATIDGIKKFEHRSSLKTWLIKVTVNQAYGHLRKNHRYVSLDGLQPDADPYSKLFSPQGRWLAPVSQWSDDTPEKLLEARVMGDCIDHHLASLPQGQRMALVLTDFNAMTVEAICEELDINPGHYRVLLHRARTSLFSMLSHYESTGDC